MPTKADKIDELFWRYETLRERFRTPNGTTDHDGEMKEWDEITSAIRQLCLKDTRIIGCVLDRIDALLTSMSRDDLDEFQIHCCDADYYIRLIIGALKVETIKPYYQRIKDLMRKASKVMERVPRRGPYSPDYALLNIVVFLDFQQKKSPDVFKQYGKLAIGALSENEITPLDDCKEHQPEEAQRYLRAAMDYVCERMLESPEEAWDPLAWIVRDYVLETKVFTDLDYFEEKLAHPFPVARFTAALILLLRKDPQHRKALQVLLETLEENAKSGTLQEYVKFLYHLTKGYKYREESSVEDLFDGGPYFAPFWSRMPLAEARRVLVLLKKLVTDNYRADLGKKPFILGKTFTITDLGVWLIAGLVMHHRELIPDCEDLVPILLEMLEEGYKLKDPPFVSPLYYASAFALQAMGGDAAKKAVEIILTRLLKDENRFDIHLIGELREFGPAAKEAVPVLRKLFHETTDVYVKAYILDSIQQITGSYTSVWPPAKPEK